MLLPPQSGSAYQQCHFVVGCMALHTVLLTVVCKLIRGEFMTIVDANNGQLPSALCFCRRLNAMN